MWQSSNADLNKGKGHRKNEGVATKKTKKKKNLFWDNNQIYIWGFYFFKLRMKCKTMYKTEQKIKVHPNIMCVLYC